MNEKIKIEAGTLIYKPVSVFVTDNCNWPLEVRTVVERDGTLVLSDYYDLIDTHKNSISGAKELANKLAKENGGLILHAGPEVVSAKAYGAFLLAAMEFSIWDLMQEGLLHRQIRTTPTESLEVRQ